MLASTVSNATITTYFLRDRIAPPNDVMPTDILLISETVVVNVALAYGTNGAHLGQQLADSLGSQTNGQSYGTGGTNNGQQLSNSLGSQSNNQVLWYWRY